MLRNKHGQTLILFIILIPIILIIIAFIIDIGIVITSKSHLKEVTRTIIRENIDNYDYDNIRKLMQKNNIEIKNLKITNEDNILIISNEIKVESIFGKVIGIDNYKIRIKAKSFKNNDKIIIEF